MSRMRPEGRDTEESKALAEVPRDGFVEEERITVTEAGKRIGMFYARPNDFEGLLRRKEPRGDPWQCGATSTESNR